RLPELRASTAASPSAPTGYYVYTGVEFTGLGGTAYPLDWSTTAPVNCSFNPGDFSIAISPSPAIDVREYTLTLTPNASIAYLFPSGYIKTYTFHITKKPVVIAGTLPQYKLYGAPNGTTFGGVAVQTSTAAGTPTALEPMDTGKVGVTVQILLPGGAPSTAGDYDDVIAVPGAGYKLRFTLATINTSAPDTRDYANNYSIINQEPDFEIKPRPYTSTVLETTTITYLDEDSDIPAPWPYVKLNIGTEQWYAPPGSSITGPYVYATRDSDAIHAGTNIGAIKPDTSATPYGPYIRLANGAFQFSNNYTIVPGITGNLEILPKPVTLTPTNAVKYFGQYDSQMRPSPSLTGIPLVQVEFPSTRTNPTAGVPVPYKIRIAADGGKALPGNWAEDLYIQMDRLGSLGEAPGPYTLQVAPPPILKSTVNRANTYINYGTLADNYAVSPATITATLTIQTWSGDNAELKNAYNGVEAVGSEAGGGWYIGGNLAQIGPPSAGPYAGILQIAPALSGAATNNNALFTAANATGSTLFGPGPLSITDDMKYAAGNSGSYRTDQPNPVPAGQVSIQYFMRHKGSVTDDLYDAISVPKDQPPFSQDTELLGFQSSNGSAYINVSDYNTREMVIQSLAAEPIYLRGDILDRGSSILNPLQWRTDAVPLAPSETKPFAVRDGNLAAIACTTPGLTPFSSPHTSTKEAYNADYSNPAGFVLEVRDYAGNSDSITYPLNFTNVPDYTPAVLKASSPMPIGTMGYVMSRTGGSFFITGEPKEPVKVVHYNGRDTYTYYILLDASGKAEIRVSMSGILTTLQGSVIGGVNEPINGCVWDIGERSFHPQQHITFSYADEDHLSDIFSTTLDFIYGGFALPITVDPQFLDRDFSIPITLPEDGAVTVMKAGKQVLYDSAAITGPWSAQAKNVKNDIPLTWMNTPVQLPLPGKDMLSVTYMNLVGETYTGFFDIDKSEVKTPIKMYISPIRHQGKFIHASDRYMRIFGTATEYEPLLIGIDGINKNIPVTYVSGHGPYDFMGTDRGEWSVTIPLSLLPKNRPLEVRARYRDVYGEGDLVKDVVTILLDETPAVIITTPEYEGMGYVAGIAQPGAKVSLSMMGPDGKRISIRVTADEAGYFLAELPETYIGAVTVVVTNPDGTTQQLLLSRWKEPQAIKAYPVGKLFPHYFEDGVADWLQATPVTAAELAEGITLPLLAGNTFEIGTVTVGLENGKVVYSYTLNDERIVVEQEYVTAEPGRLDEDRLEQILRRAPGAPGRTEVTGTGIYWLILELWVRLPEECMITSPHLLTKEGADPIHLQYLGYQF
ncbi:MAG: hypothetical protein FWF86_01325, partial [Clostridia bacterium]|nr:hypothetical protein [Clostridia bacterium]